MHTPPDIRVILSHPSDPLLSLPLIFCQIPVADQTECTYIRLQKQVAVLMVRDSTFSALLALDQDLCKDLVGILIQQLRVQNNMEQNKVGPELNICICSYYRCICLEE